MNTDFSDIYFETLDSLQDKISEITMSMNLNSNSKSNYRIIPYTKKNKKFIHFNALNINTKESILIFYSPKTIGIKMYNANNKLIYEYSVSQNENTKIVQLQYGNRTGLKHIYKFNQNENRYEIVETNIVEHLKNIVDISEYPYDIVDDNLILHITYKRPQEKRQVKMILSLGDYSKIETDQYYYSLNQHPELGEILDDMKEKIDEILEIYTKCYYAIEPEKFIQKTQQFYESFKNMIKKLESKQNNKKHTDPDSENR